jgi:hypothetical protein
MNEAVVFLIQGCHLWGISVSFHRITMEGEVCLISLLLVLPCMDWKRYAALLAFRRLLMFLVFWLFTVTIWIIGNWPSVWEEKIYSLFKWELVKRKRIFVSCTEAIEYNFGFLTLVQHIFWAFVGRGMASNIFSRLAHSNPQAFLWRNICCPQGKWNSLSCIKFTREVSWKASRIFCVCQ